MSTEATVRFRATSTIGERITREGSAAALSTDPLIWADPLAIAAIPPNSFRSFAGPYGRNWRIERTS
jgi:hypothetical protein